MRCGTIILDDWQSERHDSFLALEQMNKLESLFSETLFGVYRRQMLLLDKLGSGDWSIDVPNHTLTTASGEAWRFQTLGMETQGVWMWAWADQGNLNAESTRFAARVREHGERQSLSELTTPKLETGGLACGSHTLALVAASLSDSSPYFVAPQGDVALFILIDDSNYPSVLPTLSPAEFVAMFIQMSADYMIPQHRLAISAALKAQGFSLTFTESGITGTRSDGVIEATLDASGQITGLRAA